MIGLLFLAFCLGLATSQPSTNSSTGADSSGNASQASSLSDLFGGLTLTDILLLSAILALILFLLGIMAYQRHRAQRAIDQHVRAGHDYADRSLRAQTTAPSIQFV